MILQSWFGDLDQLVTKKHLFNLAISIAIFLVGTFLAKRSRSLVDRLPQLDTQQRILVTKILYYSILLTTFAAALAQIGVDVRVVVGAAGVLTVAIGFAAQTSTSNLISGIFLMVERPFGVGDVIAIGDVRGEVMSIDLMSSKIRTFSNLMVRIPNETLVKSNLINYSYFPVRRLDFNLNVAYDSDLRAVEKLLRGVARTHPLSLEDPEPIFIVNSFAESAISLQFQVWTLTENMTKLQNELYREIKAAFDQGGVRIPYPTRQVVQYAAATAGLAPPPSSGGPGGGGGQGLAPAGFSGNATGGVQGLSPSTPSVPSYPPSYPPRL